MYSVNRRPRRQSVRGGGAWLAGLALLAGLLLAVSCGSDNNTAKSAATPVPTGGSGGSGAGPSATTIPPTSTGGSTGRAKVSVKLTGGETFDGELSQEAACTGQNLPGAHTLSVGAVSNDVSVSFTVINPATGKAQVVTAAGAISTGTRVTGLIVKVKDHAYLEGQGEATITDPDGKKGNLTAEKFTAVGGRTGSTIKLELQWECQ